MITWWNEQRLAKDFSFLDITNKMKNPRSKSTVSRWFSGREMPSDEQIKDLCNIFGVPFKEGKKHFEEALTTTDAKPKCKVPYTRKSIDYPSICEKVYGKLPYNLYIKLLQSLYGTKEDDYIFEAIYRKGRYTYDEFEEVCAVLKKYMDT